MYPGSNPRGKGKDPGNNYDNDDEYFYLKVSNYRTWDRERQRKGRKLNRAHMMEDEEKRMKVKRRRVEDIDKVQ